MKMSEIFLDELECIETQLKKCMGDCSAFKYDEIVLVSDGGALSQYLYYFFTQKMSVKVCCVGHEDLDGYLKESHTKSRLIFFFAGGDRLQAKKYLDQWLEETEKGGGNFIFVPVFSFSAPHPEGIVSVAENELYSLASGETEGSEVRLVAELEAFCGERVKHGVDIKTVRFDNVFGPHIDDRLGIRRIVEDIAKNNMAELKKSDMAVTYTGCYIREAIVALCLVAAKGKADEVYNAASCEFTLWDIKSSLLKKYKDNDPKVTFTDDEGEKGYKKLDTRKLKNLGFEAVSDLDDALYRTACATTGEEYKGGYLTEIYHGKLERIKSLELDMMAAIDKICRENDIKYFLVGGSLLGAVRHKGFIPWDDDIDIGMLREDYDKFRKIAPALLPDNMCYQSFAEEGDSHYVFDKIRLKDTFFSTRFSGQFDNMQNGIFIDILVYDKTANSESMQKLHIKAVKFFTKLISVRWLGKDRGNGAKSLIVKLIKAVPFGVYHSMLDSVLKIYKNKKDSRYLIDGVGQYLMSGAFPSEWFEELIDFPYEDTSFKGPQGYDGYLRHWYGDSYGELLPISRRASGHNISRLDLGEYLFKGADTE